MTQIEEKYRLLEIPFYVENQTLYQNIISAYKHVLELKEGCTIHFYKPHKLIPNDFPEKPWYPRKIERLKQSVEEFSSLVDELNSRIKKLEDKTKLFLEAEYLTEGLLIRYKGLKKKRSIKEEVERRIKNLELLDNNLFDYLPDIGSDLEENELVISSWQLKEGDTPIQKYFSEIGKPFQDRSKRRVKIAGQNCIYLPIIEDNRTEIVVYSVCLNCVRIIPELKFDRLNKRPLLTKVDFWRRKNDTFSIIFSRPVFYLR